MDAQRLAVLRSGGSMSGSDGGTIMVCLEDESNRFYESNRFVRMVEWVFQRRSCVTLGMQVGYHAIGEIS